MKKTILLSLFFALAIQTFGQKYYTKTGRLDFEGSVPIFEPVRAVNTTTTAILDVSYGKIAVLSLIKGFRFRNALMEEHFNENFMDTHLFTKATFNGTIEDFNINDIDEKKEYRLKGNLKINGRTKKINEVVYVVKNGDAIDINTNFTLIPKDFNIKIPGILKEKIAKKINLVVSFHLKKRT